MEDGVEDDVEEFLGEAVEVGLEGGGVGVGHDSLFFLSFLLLMLGAWGGGSSCCFLVLTCYFRIESSSTDIRKSWRCGGGSWLVYVSSLEVPRYRSFLSSDSG